MIAPVCLLAAGFANHHLGSSLYRLNAIFIFALPVWIHSWFYREGGRQAWWKALALGAAMTLIMFAFGVGVSALLMAA